MDEMSLRRPLLYPAELQGRSGLSYCKNKSLQESDRQIRSPNNPQKDAEQSLCRASCGCRDSDDGFVEWLSMSSIRGYEVSNTGLVRKSGDKRLLPQRPNRYGYPQVTLRVNGKNITRPVHALVAEVFLGPRPDRMTVDHLDGDKTNNHATNLEYVTRKENIQRAFKNGQYDHVRGEGSPSAKLNEEQVREIKGLLNTHNNCELGRRFGVSDVAIRKIRLGKTWRHVEGGVT